jgi:small-conductance mechanosensitive channel
LPGAAGDGAPCAASGRAGPVDGMALRARSAVGYTGGMAEPTHRPPWQGASLNGHSKDAALDVLHAGLRGDVRRALIAAVLALVAFAAGSNLGGLHAPQLRDRLIAAGLALMFAVFGVITTRCAARGLARAASHTSPGAGAATRLLCVLFGYLIVGGGTLGLLTVPWQHLLVGGAVTGVVAGIAAQQPLSNLFAGLVLLLARPVSVGRSLRVHSGALGGPHDGTITDIGLIYTTLHNDSETLLIPNAALLGSALRCTAPGESNTPAQPNPPTPPAPSTDIPPVASA